MHHYPSSSSIYSSFAALIDVPELTLRRRFFSLDGLHSIYPSSYKYFADLHGLKN
jgi:hypothetical protein